MRKQEEKETEKKISRKPSLGGPPKDPNDYWPDYKPIDKSKLDETRNLKKDKSQKSA